MEENCMETLELCQRERTREKEQRTEMWVKKGLFEKNFGPMP